jgi:hypothetical protein
MPAYTFENIKTGEEYTIHMPMSEIDDYLKKNKNIRQVFTTLNIVGGVAGITYKNDQGWKDNMSRIAEAHPNSPHAERYGKKTIKQTKTKQVIDKHRKRNKW